MWRRSESDDRFRVRFETFEIQAGAFGHKDHLRLAYVHLTDAGPEPALASLRGSLRAFLEHHGADPAKYHETVTRAWILAVHHFMHRTGPADSFEAFISANAELLDVKIMESHYSRARLESEEARRRFVEPDLDPIPRH